MSLLAFILTLLLGENDKTFVGHAVALPVIQAFGDGNIYTIGKSMFGDINPAIMTQSAKILDNT
jgi:hypothetical protein